MFWNICQLFYVSMPNPHCSYFAEKRYNKAEQTLKKAELVSRERNELGAQYRNYERRLKIFTTLGKICLKQRKFGSALEWFEKVRAILKMIGCQWGIGDRVEGSTGKERGKDAGIKRVGQGKGVEVSM